MMLRVYEHRQTVTFVKSLVHSIGSVSYTSGMYNMNNGFVHAWLIVVGHENEN